MIVRKEKLQAYLDKQQLIRADFAKKLGVEISEVDKMLSGEPVGYDTAKKFIYYMKASRAQHFVDWEATGVENPLSEKNALQPQDESKDKKETG